MARGKHSRTTLAQFSYLEATLNGGQGSLFGVGMSLASAETVLSTGYPLVVPPISKIWRKSGPPGMQWQRRWDAFHASAAQAPGPSWLGRAISGIESGGAAVSDHAPGTHQVPHRLVRWINDLSDIRISLYMLVTAIVAGIVIYALDRGLLG